MIDYVRGGNPYICMKVTEAGIDGFKSDRGYRYRDFGQRIARETYGRIDSVCPPPATFHSCDMTIGDYT